jgi:EAL domain-containing protein (putative c-di-GMP-specific phosphodiesterase class I)
MWHALQWTGLAPSAETEMERKRAAEDHGTSRGLMRNLKTLGVRQAIDDVGTGCGSSSDLPLYAFDVLKIDCQCHSRPHCDF